MMEFSLLDIYENGVVSIRWETLTGYVRETRQPGAEISDLPPAVQQRISERWTPELLADWQETGGL